MCLVSSICFRCVFSRCCRNISAILPELHLVDLLYIILNEAVCGLIIAIEIIILKFRYCREKNEREEKWRILGNENMC